MTLTSITWDIDILARSSIVHRADYSDSHKSNFTLFRREKIVAADGQVTSVPIVSGSSFRGILRRIGEELTAAALGYEDVSLPVPAAHLLTNGGRLAKSKAPITDEGERHLKALIPLIAVFGGAGSGRLMSGLLTVSKVLPEVAELAHILYRPGILPEAPLSSVRALSEESFTHLADYRPSLALPPASDPHSDDSPLNRISVEVLPAGMRLQAYVRINNATETHISFLRDVLDVFAARGHLGGRRAAGYGQITASLHAQLPPALPDWQSELRARRDEAIAALCEIT
ncbi:RAMP superfamily CRISPR-associated protein [Mycobacterium sp. smrl_JER01]|uniref:RAMP superfamily CRISPR-associated protein n=1 Tax=Mycobacterium sp. smrl_JER01 TaxID=3402633 RepID=UPI003ACDAC97